MTTALRLPDPFTPDTTAASAATPTCCCCCCCCAVSVVSGAVALPSGLANDLAEAERPRARAAWVLPAGLYLPGVLVVPFTAAEDYWLHYVVVGAVAAMLWAFLAAKVTGAAKPSRGVVRLLVWMSLFAAELVLSLPLLSPLGLLGPWGAGIVYALLAGTAGRQVRRFYARRVAA